MTNKRTLIPGPQMMLRMTTASVLLGLLLWPPFSFAYTVGHVYTPTQYCPTPGTNICWWDSVAAGVADYPVLVAGASWISCRILTQIGSVEQTGDNGQYRTWRATYQTSTAGGSNCGPQFKYFFEYYCTDGQWDPVNHECLPIPSPGPQPRHDDSNSRKQGGICPS